MKTLLFALLLFVPTAALCQNAKIDSLKRVIETTKVDTVKGRTLCRLCWELQRSGFYAEGIRAGELGLQSGKKNNDIKAEGECSSNLGVIYSLQGDFSKALDYNKRSLKVFKALDDLANTAFCLNNIGVIHSRTGEYLVALDYFQRSLAIRENIGDHMGIANCLGNIGNIHMYQGNHAKSIECNLRALKLIEKTGDSSKIGISYNNIGNIYKDQGQNALALQFFRKSLEIMDKTGDRFRAAHCRVNIGGLYMSQGDYTNALEIYRQSLEIFEEAGNQPAITATLGNISQIYYFKGEYDRALALQMKCLKLLESTGDRAGIAFTLSKISRNLLKQKKNALAHEYAQRGFSIARQTGNMRYKQASAAALFQADSALGDWKGAFEAARLFHIYSDSLKNDEQSKELGRLESKAEYDKQAEIDRLKNEADQQRERERFIWALGSAGGGLLLLLVIAFTLFRGRQKEKKANTALRALNEEINQQKGEIEAINAELQATLREVNEQKHEIEEQHAKIEDSIRYASRIQGAIMPSEAQLQGSMPPHFIHYQPRDIVSGDFFWMTKHQDKAFFAAVDCTGHGVPGAFMSVLGSNLLHQIVDENQITEPDVILAELDRRIAATLHQQLGGDSKDGMDLALVVIYDADAKGRRTVEYAGAGRPLWIWSNGEITEYKSAKYSCGGSQHESKEYPAHRIAVNAGDRLYVFSDGPVDQFGGPNGRKLGSPQLQSFLYETANLPIDEQGKRFGAFFNDWMKAKKQLDDVLLAGIAL